MQREVTSSAENELSEKTIAFLLGLCFASHVSYTEAGMVFKLVKDKKASLNEIPLDARERPFLITDHSAPFPETAQIRNFARFIIGSIGGNTDRIPSHSEAEAAYELVVLLHADLRFDWFSVEVDECDYGMDLMFHMGREQSKSVATLCMTWRID